MRLLFLNGLACLYLCLGVGAGGAAVKIDARPGFPNGSGGGNRLKVGCWAPVQVTVTTDDGSRLPPGCTLVAESPDREDWPGQYIRELPVDPPYTVLTYVLPGNMYSNEITLSVRAPDGRVLANNRLPPLLSYQEALPPRAYLALSLGAALPDFSETLKRKNEEEKAEGRLADVVTLTSVQDLPDRWLGYQGIDLIILTTGKQSFVDELASNQLRREALAEWVRRGGCLVISLSADKHLGSRIDLLEKLGLGLDLQVENKPAHEGRDNSWKELGSVVEWARGKYVAVGGEPLTGLPARPESLIDAAWLKINRQPRLRTVGVLIERPGKSLPEAEHLEKPLLVEAPCGLGRVVVSAIDLDGQPFTGWNGRYAFWNRLRQHLFPHWPDPDSNPGAVKPGQLPYAQSSPELADRLLSQLEVVEGVPPVPFGLIALFIVVYILIVGPLDYFFLKKVVKRLELTWITFPTIVLVTSGIAYYAAYKLKGKDLKINKVDVVDLHAAADPDESGSVTVDQAHGATWVSLYSPHTKYYTLGLQPAESWVGDGKGQKPDLALSVFPRLEESGHGGMDQSSGMSRRPYTYQVDQGGMAGVPIRVWATKTFTGTWEARELRGKGLFRATLREKASGGLEGTLQSGLPVALDNVVLFYPYGKKGFYVLGSIGPGNSQVKVDLQPHRDLGQWGSGVPYGDPTGQVGGTQGWELVQKVLLPDANSSRYESSSMLRWLDQSWRLNVTKPRNEAILIGRVAPRSGPAEGVNEDPVSATRLWIDALPGAGGKRPDLEGGLVQQTYVRIFLPVVSKR